MIGRIGRIGRIGNHTWRRRLMERAYDDLLQTLNLLGVLGVLAVHLRGAASAG
ncbi:MAG: hypothetical protein QM518_11245 [Verrucomicrobiota bacterium]|nr:hypothetical protein [Verrucomicrobiota bacterium]